MASGTGRTKENWEVIEGPMTYNGWPLYLWHGDVRPGEATGQGLNDSGGCGTCSTPTAIRSVPIHELSRPPDVSDCRSSICSAGELQCPPFAPVSERETDDQSSDRQAEDEDQEVAGRMMAGCHSANSVRRWCHRQSEGE